METMTTLSETITKLKAEGYRADFNLRANCLEYAGGSLKLFPDEFEVDRHYRFEGASDPADEAVVYAISSAKHQLKGTLVNGYGMYSEPLADEMLRTLHPRHY